VHLAACWRACTFNKLLCISPSLLRSSAARPCGAAGISTPGGELAQTPDEVRWLLFLSVCAVLGRLQRAHVVTRVHSARVLLLLLS